MQTEKPRWVYRFDNYGRALAQFRAALGILRHPSPDAEITKLLKEGLIQRFEYSWELAWKVLKDYLEERGVTLDVKTPASVIRAAFAAGLIADGDAWMECLRDRNHMSHTYDADTFQRIVTRITELHSPLLEALFHRMEVQSQKEFPHG